MNRRSPHLTRYASARHTLAGPARACPTRAWPTRACPTLGKLALALLFAPALLLAGCGHWDYDGNVLVDNQTDNGVPEDVLAFRLARFGDPFTGNLLAAPLPPGSTEHLGGWHEDYYDAEADMQGGDLVEWFDTWIYADEDNFFDIF